MKMFKIHFCCIIFIILCVPLLNYAQDQSWNLGIKGGIFFPGEVYVNPPDDYFDTEMGWLINISADAMVAPKLSMGGFFLHVNTTDEYFEEGGEMRYTRYTESWETLIAGLRKLNFQFLLPLEQQSKLLTAVIDPQDANYKFEEMHDYLYERGYTIYPGKGAKKDTFRIANIGAINKGDIESFLDVLGEYLESFNVVV